MRMCPNVPGAARDPDRARRLPVHQRVHPARRPLLRAERAALRSCSTRSPASSCVEPRGALYCFPRLDPEVYPIEDDEAVRHRPAAGQEDPGHPRHRLQLVRARPLPPGDPARRRRAHRGHRPHRRLPRDPAGLTRGRPGPAPGPRAAGLRRRRWGRRLAGPLRGGRRAAARTPAPSRGRRSSSTSPAPSRWGCSSPTWSTAPGVHRLARPFVGVGVLGGWTTFSALAVDAVQLGSAGQEQVALVYLTATFLLGTLAVAAGSLLGQRVWPGP